MCRTQDQPFVSAQPTMSRTIKPLRGDRSEAEPRRSACKCAALTGSARRHEGSDSGESESSRSNNGNKVKQNQSLRTVLIVAVDSDSLRQRPIQCLCSIVVLGSQRGLQPLAGVKAP